MSAAQTVERLESVLEYGTRQLGVELAPDAAAKLLRLVALIQQWNRVYNLTAIVEPEQMLVQHILDSLAIVPAVRRAATVEPTRLLDVGSGAGLPGLVIAVACQSVVVTCVDAVGKKAAFIRHAAMELALPQVEALHARVEDLSPRQWMIIVSRAFAALGKFVELTEPLLAEDGRWLAMKGHLPLEEEQHLRPDIEVFHVEPVRVPGLKADRCLVWMRRRAA